MQSKPLATSTHTSNRTTASEPTNSSQHGLRPEQLHSADRRDPVEEDRVEVTSLGHSRILLDPQSADNARLQVQLRRLGVSDRDHSRPKPSYQRISEYENASSPSPTRKQNEGPSFKIIKKKGDSTDGPHLYNFPNEVLTHILSHLPAASLSAVSLVSRQFYSLVTTPHAWRIAFSRFFPGQDAVYDAPPHSGYSSDQEARERLQSEVRFFTRLTGLASWRSEYILRTRLLRSLARGKPKQIAPGHGASSRPNSAANNANAVVTYSSQLFATVNHIHAIFSGGKKSPRFIHGTDESGSACTSDPNIGKIDNWGLSDPQTLPQFADLFVGDQPYGDGEGAAGAPNVMDVSQPFGMVCGEGFPGGSTYYRSSLEQRGRFLADSSNTPNHRFGIPKIPRLTEAISAVWIAKSNSVPAMTNGLIGMMTGSTLGVVTAYSLGAETPNGFPIARGHLTSKWIISPGVPIIRLEVDDSFNEKRKAAGRIWAVALNALGEVFYLTDLPSSPLFDVKAEDVELARHAWDAGRTAYFSLIEPSRRIAKDDPYHEAETHGSYSPRSSSKKMQLSKAQIVAETAEIEKFLVYRPSHFRKICVGWDMRRRMEVDFGGDVGNGAGEAIFVIKCGIGAAEKAEITRFTRWKSEQASLEAYPFPKTPPISPNAPTMASLFGGGNTITPPTNASPDRSQSASIFTGSTPISPVRKVSPNRSSSSTPGSLTASVSTALVEEWKYSVLSLKNHNEVEITSTAIDMSSYALLTVDEDPIQTVNGRSAVSSTPANVPGQRARFIAVGTSTGLVLMWNMRSPNATLVNEIQPLRKIETASPQISCLAISALYVVIGGNDGLVQSWDPLASTLQPVRTLNSRFSSRARRRLVQAEGSIHGVGINLYAAGAIALDPDPTVLRGIVSLGTHLRYWAYSSSAADQYQSKKRRLRRSGERGSNSGPDRFTNTGRGALIDYIATEQEELKKEKLRRSREEARLRGRFGVGLGGLSDEEALKYAEMVSAETFQKYQERRMSDTTGYFADAVKGSTSQSVWSSSTTVTPEGSIKGRASSPRKFKTDDEFENDIEEAIRLSLLDGVDDGGRSPRASGSGDYDIPITYKQKKIRRSASSSPSISQASKNYVKTDVEGSKSEIVADYLNFAIQLSPAKERSRREAVVNAVDEHQEDDFSLLESGQVEGKGKGRAI